jgi:predicted nucleotide-binding protein
VSEPAYSIGPIASLRFDPEVGRFLTRKSLSESEEEALKEFFAQLQTRPLRIDRAVKAVTPDTWLFSVANHVVYLKLISPARAIVVGIQPDLTSSDQINSVTVEKPTRRKVLVLHDRDLVQAQSIKVLLERAGLQPILLSEQPASGRTISETLTDYANQVDYAVVVVSSDAHQRTETVFRQRQNILFEIGYLIGLLGRDRVSLLVGDRSDIASDLAGTQLIELDQSGAWRLGLFRSLKNAGLDVRT